MPHSQCHQPNKRRPEENGPAGGLLQAVHAPTRGKLQPFVSRLGRVGLWLVSSHMWRSSGSSA